MANDCYSSFHNQLYLLPTSEVSLVNFYANQVIQKSLLPIKLTAFSHCFRREAGAAGRDNRGLVRLHEFQKVEIVRLVQAKNSYEHLEEMKKRCLLHALNGSGLAIDRLFAALLENHYDEKTNKHCQFRLRNNFRTIRLNRKTTAAFV
ncbi:uncharacterized protein LOC110988009 [Acanthaster planci]|uniref:serine--tRNA ligase n=1 Tax=Acanthaster planci TaxID=133434 RepID=A0A8B7ZPE8_ACAPL|nr:uncharacterized protein LOC110988009 [Acanthaster planci]